MFPKKYYKNKPNIVFDCYDTLIYKSRLKETTQKFIQDIFHIKVPLFYIDQAFTYIYDRYKFSHPTFPNHLVRKKFYQQYNKELLAIIGFSINNSEADKLNQLINQSTYYHAFPDTKSLKNLSSKYNLHLLANWTNTFESALNQTSIATFFKTKLSSHELKIQKPNPKIFKITANLINLSPENLIYVGNDYELDIIPARSAGWTPILIDRFNRYPKSIDCLKINSLFDLNLKIKKIYQKLKNPKK